MAQIRGGMGIINPVGKLERGLRVRVAVRKHARQLQRSCVIQPSVGAKRLRWVARENENNSEGVGSAPWWMQAPAGPHLCSRAMKMAQAPSGAQYAAPGGAWDFGGPVSYKDSAPDGAAQRGQNGRRRERLSADCDRGCRAQAPAAGAPAYPYIEDKSRNEDQPR